MMKKKISLFAAAFIFALVTEASASELSMNTAVMQAMDKITGHVDLIEVPVNQEVLFGTFSILVRECRTSAPEEEPENFAFVDIVDNVSADTKINIFKGWMVSSSPALNPVAHPVYDVWLLKCLNTPANKIKPMSEEELALRDNIDMKRTPQRESINLAKEVYDDIENELQQANDAPENLIPEALVEEPVEDVVPEDEGENVVNTPNTQENLETTDASEPEALVIIKEEEKKEEKQEKQEMPEADSNVSSNWEDVLEQKNETDILQLEKELSEKAISD